MWLDAWVSTQNIVISNNFFPKKKSSNLERFTASIKFSFYDHQMKKWNLSKGSAARALWNSLWELNRQGSFLAWSYQRQRKSDGKNHRENSMNRSHYHYLPIYVERNTDADALYIFHPIQIHEIIFHGYSHFDTSTGNWFNKIKRA